MAIFLFFITGATGFILTTLTFRRALKQEHRTHHQYALILTVGFGLTWLFSFFVPFFAPGSPILKPSLALFWIAHSILVAAITYSVARIWFKLWPRSDS
jgi:hypothetical protein